MDFKHQYGEEKVSVLLPQRSLLVMSGESRLKWTHGLVQYLKPYNYTCYTCNHGNHTDTFPCYNIHVKITQHSHSFM